MSSSKLPGEKQICFFQASRFDSLASLMAAHGASPNSVIELDADEETQSPYEAVLETLFSSDSIQSW
ncbi:hypothetical protein N9B57_02245 [Verrucomicrobia bacterium]|nr:hypothetical protein [Verrucomicrobiota bacterium]